MAAQFLRLAYDRQPYNRFIEAEEDIYIKANLSERLIGWAGIGSDYYISDRLNEIFLGKARIAPGIRIKSSIGEKLNGNVDIISGTHIISQSLIEALGGTGHMSATLNIATKILEILKGNVTLGADLYVMPKLQEMLFGTVHMGSSLYSSQRLYEVLSGYADVRNIAEFITSILGSIPAGATLVIDAENFNMTLQQGSNITDVIPWHKGDWIWIGRSSMSFTLSGIGNNSYEWDVFYNALYL